MKTLKIQIPEGHEIDQEKSTFEQIVFKKIENKLPTSAKEIGGRKWFINTVSQIVGAEGFPKDDGDNNCLSSKQRAEAFLALMQLVELRDAWNGDWKDDKEKYTIIFFEGKVERSSSYSVQSVLSFKSEDLRDKFLEQFRDLIETAKELI